jgi:hypothetical protein
LGICSDRSGFGTIGVTCKRPLGCSRISDSGTAETYATYAAETCAGAAYCESYRIHAIGIAKTAAEANHFLGIHDTVDRCLHDTACYYLCGASYYVSASFGTSAHASFIDQTGGRRCAPATTDSYAGGSKQHFCSHRIWTVASTGSSASYARDRNHPCFIWNPVFCFFRTAAAYASTFYETDTFDGCAQQYFPRSFGWKQWSWVELVDCEQCGCPFRTGADQHDQRHGCAIYAKSCAVVDAARQHTVFADAWSFGCAASFFGLEREAIDVVFCVLGGVPCFGDGDGDRVAVFQPAIKWSVRDAWFFVDFWNGQHGRAHVGYDVGLF